MALRSSRWMFSTRAISMTFSSLMVRIYAGMVVSPASCEALQRRSPAMIWKRSWSTCRSVMGCTMPSWRMELASSSRATGSNSRRGWLGLASICCSGTSLMVLLPCVLTDSVEMSASSPRPSALVLTLRLYFLCTGMSYPFLLCSMISLARDRWLRAPAESAS